ncbi:helix-turn-helix domain-containing protein [Desulfonatronum thioautotrophicum]|uniref:helix-turn-helix domain-containing protein n=1 Tax=Desulfonatronum thioautotrophicum TaxID=617001 RepID=UPI0005EBCA0B|nr:XRE family transcriptional regulator [Desulfonatronum thioautotrophicum]
MPDIPADAPPYAQIAPRLRGLREALDLTVEQMAARIESTPDKVALYESGTVEIPVSHLFQTAKSCGVDLTVLLSGGEAHLHNHALVRKGKGMSVDRRKDYAYKSLAYNFTGRRMEPFLVTVPPKDEQDLTFTEHAGQEFIHMLSGRLELRLGEQVLILEPGDSLFFTSRTPHALRGLDQAEAVFLDVII